MPPIHGSCLCGGVEFEIAGPLTAPLNCHCSQCRKQHGAAFRSRVRVQSKDFRWLKGEHLVSAPWKRPVSNSPTAASRAFGLSKNIA
jgi:hypothetical protein